MALLLNLGVNSFASEWYAFDDYAENDSCYAVGKGGIAEFLERLHDLGIYYELKDEKFVKGKPVSVRIVTEVNNWYVFRGQERCAKAIAKIRKEQSEDEAKIRADINKYR